LQVDYVLKTYIVPYHLGSSFIPQSDVIVKNDGHLLIRTRSKLKESPEKNSFAS